MAIPIHITDNTFDAEVLRSDIPVLSDFWAEWCGARRTIGPILFRSGLLSEEGLCQINTTVFKIRRKL